MSDLSGSSRSMLTNNSHASSRPKFQPLRVKELLDFCESDDDESEDKTQGSDSESDSDDPQPLPQDDDVRARGNDNGREQTVELAGICRAGRTIVSPDHGQPVCVNEMCKPGSGEFFEQSERHTSCEQSVQVQSDIENRTQEKIFQLEQRSRHADDVRRQSSHDQMYNNQVQSVDQTFYRKSSSNEPVASAPSGVCRFQNANLKREASESKENEEKAHETVSSTKFDAGTFVNHASQWTLQTPMKFAPVNPVHPDPCFSRRNIEQTPRNRSSDIPKNHGLTPSTILSNWTQGDSKQTPLQTRSINFKDSMQTPKNCSYFTPTVMRTEKPMYLSTEVRKPLADAGCFTQNSVPNRHLFQGSQISNRVTMKNEVTSKDESKTCKNIIKTSLSRQMPETLENVHLESDVNDRLKENKHSNVEGTMVDKKTVRNASNSRSVAHSIEESREASMSVHDRPQSQRPEASNQSQQEELQKIVNNVPHVQFSTPSNIPKSRQSKTLFVKGKEYLILGTLGQGMSGEVLRVQDLSSLELCAIKCVNLSRIDKESAQGCLEEISMLHKLQAPCVVKMFDYEINYPMVYVVMEMGDTDLSRLLRTMLQEKQIPLTMILYYWTEMLTAVKHIHDNGVIHSDLKPANFLLVRGRLKLIDFGIASSMNADMTSVVKNCPIGTLNYISPEALMDTGGGADSPTQDVKYKISFKSDVWSLGCILYSLVYGRTPFHHIRSQWAKVNAITNPKLNISFPTTLPSGNGNKVIPSPPILIDVMRKCLQHDPKARPTVAELLQVEYIPTTQEHISRPPEIPANILIKIKNVLNDEEWRQLTRILESR
ncbi:serine/threonine-protein kinase WARTS homolog [Ceratina calcarata]|uniref:Serine/threonine-protein kinase WARTS homolog n=1 Tax=Ceratina calcarata TaxID=156304 RepID=A0AAJ7IZ99_9HYME|nr:serine/threonine-protein kinase WARTS homolog [Ceratina calcarata]